MSSISLNNALQQFSIFVANESFGDDQSACIGSDGKVKAAQKSASWLSRKIENKAGVDSKAESNAVRTAFLNALKLQFNVNDVSNLPPLVLQALRGTHAKTELDDFALEGQKATSGKPLTKRRIRAVLAAVAQAHAQTLGVQGPAVEVTYNVIHQRGELLNGEYADRLTEAMTSNRDVVVHGRNGTKTVQAPLVAERFQSIVPMVIKNVMSLLAKAEPGKLAKIRRNFRTIVGDSCGVIAAPWTVSTSVDANGVRVKGDVYRTQVLDQIFDNLIRDFNAAHPELAIR